MKFLYNKRKGNIALLTVLIATSVMVVSGITLVSTTVDFSSSSKNYTTASTLKIISKSCLEESIYKLKKDTNYNGTFVLTMTDGSCTTAISNDSIATNRLISIQSSSSTYKLTESYKVNISVNPFTIIK